MPDGSHDCDAFTSGSVPDLESAPLQSLDVTPEELESQEVLPLIQPSKALLEPEPGPEPEHPGGKQCCPSHSPAALLTTLPLASLWSTIWDSGMTCMAVSAAIQSLSALLVKITDGRVPIFEMVVVRSGICMVFTFIMARMQGIPNILGNMKYIIPLFVRGFVGALSMSVYYYALLKLSLSDMVTIFFTHPAMIVVLAWLVRGEVVRWAGLLGILASMIGTVIVSQPPFLLGGEHWTQNHIQGVIGSLLAALLAAIAFIAIRYIPKTESSVCIAYWFHLMGFLTAGLPLAVGIPDWPVLPSVRDSFSMIGVGVCSFSSHIFIARALQIEVAAKASAAGYLQVVFAYIFGLAFLGESIKVWSVLGSLVICVGVIATSWPSKRQVEEKLPVTVEQSIQDDLAESELVPLTEPQLEADVKAKIMIVGPQPPKVEMADL